MAQNGGQDAKTNDNTPPASIPASNDPGLLSWVLPALKTPRTVKVLIRCCVALASALVLMVANKTLTNLGQAAFFAAIVAVFIPPSIALSLFILSAITLLLGMLMGWAWGCAAMAAGISVRDQALLSRQQQQVQASLTSGVPQAIQFQQAVFKGMFLDPRTSAVYGAFFFIGTYLFGTIRAFYPKLALLSIFGSITLDIMCSYGPLFPTAQYTLAEIFLIPATYYIAVAIGTLIFIFPVSLNHIWLSSLQKNYTIPVTQILACQSQALGMVPSDHKSWADITNKIQALRRKLLAGTEDLLGQRSMIDLEVSVGRLGPGDLKRISNELKSLMFRTAGLQSFLVLVDKVNTIHSEEAVEEPLDEKAPYWDRYTILLRHIRNMEVKHGHDFDSLVPILASSSAELRAACEAAITGMGEWFKDCNTKRWRRLFVKYDVAQGEKRHAALAGKLTALRKALVQHRDVERVKLIKPFERFFDPVTGQRIKEKDGKNAELFAARALYICFVFSYSLDAFADRLSNLMTIIVDINAKRPKPRIWTPSGFGKLGRKLRSKREVSSQVVQLGVGTYNDPMSFESSELEIDDDDDSDDDEYGGKVQDLPKEKSARRNPDALPPTTAFGRFFLKLGKLLAFFKSPEGVFSLRHAIVSVALWIPSVCSSSAWFYYGNRGIWAVIMAQTGLAMYAGDQIAGFVVRIAGTIFGLLIGIAVWYIGAGSGSGNPYGIVIATTIFVAPFFLGRLAAPPQQMFFWILSAVTIVFVVGYSWVNRHYPVIVDTGVGVTLGWKRALLVIIGFTAGFIVMLFPRPTSARTLVRRTLAATMNQLGNILASEIEALLAEEQRARTGHHERSFSVDGPSNHEKATLKEQRVRRIAEKGLFVASRLQMLVPSLQTAKYEPQLRGTWPQAKYTELHDIQMKFISSLMLFTGAFTQLDTRWCSLLVHQAPFLNPSLLSDIFSNISILSYALRVGQPLPPLPRLRDRVIYHERLEPPRTPNNGNRKATSDSSDSESNSELEFVADKCDGSSLGFEEMSLSILTDSQLPAHATAIVALSNMITLIDEMSAIVRSLCGEMTLQGFAELQKDALGREEKVLGSGFSSRMGIR